MSTQAAGRAVRGRVLALVGGLASIAALLATATGGFMSEVTAAGSCTSVAPSPPGGPTHVAGVPRRFLPYFEGAATRFDLGAHGWAYLAAINFVESRFDDTSMTGVGSGTNSAGAAGPMQIGVAGGAGDTWDRIKVDDVSGGTHPPSVYNEADAVYAAANYLHTSGAPANWAAAIFTYNRAGWYVFEVQAAAQKYLNAAAGQPVTSVRSNISSTTRSGGVITDKGGLVAGTVYGDRHDDNGRGAYQGERLAGDFSSGSPPYAELGGRTDAAARLLGHLAPGTGLKITNPLTGQSIVAYKHDFGYGQGTHTLAGHRYRIDLWWQTAQAIGIHGSALVQLQPVGGDTGPTAPDCQTGGGPVPVTPGSRAKILPDGTAEAPADAPQDVKQMIAAGNRINHFNYSYGGAHGDPAQTMNQTHPNPTAVPGEEENGGPGYDCSSATSYDLWGGGFGQTLLGGSVDDSGELENVGAPGPGKWVSIYANGGHAYIEVAGIYLDTAAGEGNPPNPPTHGPRWAYHGTGPAGFVVRHPPGL